VPLDANGCVNQIQQTSHEGDIVLRGPPLYREHILDQPYSGEGALLEGSRYEMDSCYHHVQSCLSANLGAHGGALFDFGDLPSYCTATQAPPPHEAMDPVRVRDGLDEASGASGACLGSCGDRADLEKSEPAVLAEE
jgi:hypothetical protein